MDHTCDITQGRLRRWQRLYCWASLSPNMDLELYIKVFLKFVKTCKTCFIGRGTPDCNTLIYIKRTIRVHTAKAASAYINGI
jgi:hypothetical protein